jgi:hypothetical protein
MHLLGCQLALIMANLRKLNTLLLELSLFVYGDQNKSQWLSRAC